MCELTPCCQSCLTAEQCNYLSLFRGSVQTGVRCFRRVAEVLAWDGLCGPFPETVHCSPLLGVCIAVPTESRRWSREWRWEEHRMLLLLLLFATPAPVCTTHLCWVTQMWAWAKTHGYPCRIGVWFNTVHHFEDLCYTFVVLSPLNLRSSGLMCLLHV